MLLNASYLEECNEFLGKLRIDVRGNQVENGILKAALQANQCDSAIFLRLDFDRRVHFAGARMPGYLPCCMMTTGDSWYHGNTSEGRDLCGFNTRLTDTDVQWVGELSVMYVPESLLRHGLEEAGDAVALRRLDAFNSITLTPKQRGDFKRLFHQGISGTLQSDEQILNYLSLCLASDNALGALPEIDHDFHHFVMACQHHSKDGPVPLLTIIRTANRLYGCHLTRDKLYRGKAFEARHQLTPIDYFKRFRLEEIRCAFIRGEVASVDEGRRKYRFSNKKQFNVDFLEAFGETPLAVLERGLRAL